MWLPCVVPLPLQVLVLAVPPVISAPGRGGSAADPQHLMAVLPHVAGLSMMTYDYGGTPGAPGPNAPLSWVEDNIQAMKVAAGGEGGGGLGQDWSVRWGLGVLVSKGLGYLQKLVSLPAATSAAPAGPAIEPPWGGGSLIVTLEGTLHVFPAMQAL
jgi:hypothetical protein